MECEQRHLSESKGSVLTRKCRRFDALLKTYEQLAEMIIFTIRLDMRCRAIHYLHSAIRFVSDKLPGYMATSLIVFA